MQYKKFIGIFNAIIFEKSKADLLRKIAENPQRYVGIFRPTKPYAKIIQNLLQSHEIRFGDAFEFLVTEYLKEVGFEILPNKLNYDGKRLDIDQLFKLKDDVFIVEQKIRDDHDSSKKEGQVRNFEKKIDVVCDLYKDKRVCGVFYFVDDGLCKNKKYYETELKKLASDYGVKIKLLYGREFFAFLNKPQIWDEIILHLHKWKARVAELPEVNFDAEADASFDEIKLLKPGVYRKLFSNDNLDEVLQVLFPKSKTLKLLSEHFAERYEKGDGKIYQTLQELCIATVVRLK